MTDPYLLKTLSRYNIGTYADIILRNAILHSHQEAFVYGDQRVTYAQFNRRVNRLVGALSDLGVQKGQVVGLLSWNCLKYLDVIGAAMKGGYIISPFNPRLKVEELVYLINYSQATTLFVGPELMQTIDELKPRLSQVRHYIGFSEPVAGMPAYDELTASQSDTEPDIFVSPDDPFIIFYTSGTTGLPRGALYTHRRKMIDTQLFALALNMTPQNRDILAIPLFHVAGTSYMLAFFYGAATSIIYPQISFDPALALKIIEAEQATDIHIVPTHLVSMLALPDVAHYNLSSLKRVWYAGSPMPVEILKKGMDMLGPVFLQAYGQSESGPLVSSLTQQAHQVLDKTPEEQKVLASCGQPFPSVHVRVVDTADQDVPLGRVGEIIVQSSSIMKEYWQQPEHTAETLKNGWLHTGDLGYFDEKGNIYLVDRKKDMIITGGENVYPREVEEVLYRHPAVAEAAVVGLPDPYWVERVHAEIVLQAGTRVEPQEIIDFCKNQIASYKAPKSVSISMALPKSPQGKILKREIKSKYRDTK